MPDVNITVVIPEAQVTEFRTAFLALYPKPPDFVGTDLAWVRRWVRLRLVEAYRMGKLRAAQDELPDGAAVINEG